MNARLKNAIGAAAMFAAIAAAVAAPIVLAKPFGGGGSLTTASNISINSATLNEPTSGNNAVNVAANGARIQLGTNAVSWMSGTNTGNLTLGFANVNGASGSIAMFSEFRGYAATSSVLKYYGNDGAAAVANTVDSDQDIVTAGAGLLNIRSAGTNVAKVSAEGGVQLNMRGVAEPTCTSARRGEIVYVRGGVGVGETIRTCLKDPTDESYAWYTLVTST